MEQTNGVVIKSNKIKDIRLSHVQVRQRTTAKNGNLTFYYNLLQSSTPSFTGGFNGALTLLVVDRPLGAHCGGRASRPTHDHAATRA
ncbi:Unannotated [Lentimonas sp. CC19]|nr:Unannotated [Lentimonas sp. CC4]CAA6684995.1 Unannotated [Lentimonas sp. CC6]CAA6691718.1 Unannotated [Lentimonas sp. CC19]CAA6696064.1 Unannotated [Lentimonas sp. CC10]CAA7070071.1 Unannotated [Lentimonas sp. CC11]CAA7169815.1 Unannotated [Lentimonas sp. CC21]CAA7179933.1 Unannotated [Lentimonas sp. CC8]